MFYSPLFQICLVLAGVFAAGFTTFVLTTRSPASAPITPPPVLLEDKKSMFLTVRCAHLPNSLVIRQGQSILVDISSCTEFMTEYPLDLTIPDSGKVRLHVSASWSNNTPETPITLTLEPESQRAQAVTHWSIDHRLNDVFTFDFGHEQ